MLDLAVFSLFSAALPWRSVPCSAVLDFAVSDLFSCAFPCSAVFTMAVFSLFSGALPWRSVPCSAVLDFAVSDLFSSAFPCSAVFTMAVFSLFSSALPWWSLTCSAVLCHGCVFLVQRCFAMAGSDLCIGEWHDGPSLPSGAVAVGAFLGTDSGGGLLTSDDTAALLGTDSGGGLLTSDDTAALLGTDSGGGLLTCDDSAGGGVPAAGENGALVRRAALPRLCRLLLAPHHLSRSHS
ncbi:hypothetical protein NDU88_007195 [Pleurodeles waltl]|uniref:Secreted protein n=1 Tax=Pleurodeles waltl TaxID=8319 RepID=A0AAV7US85_PLEWA|nr:hypothetical protein NDU88_007195 [Pleurodeles waltl]